MGNALGLVSSETVALCRGSYQRTLYRAGWLLLAFPLLLLWQLGNWICLLLDELLFSSARKLRIEKPILILGPPRSGTTFLHRILADASVDFQSAPAWELLLAPSILQKQMLFRILALDRGCGSPLKKLFCRLEKGILKRFADTHPGSLRDPEEDYFYLSPMFACTGWMIAFPAWKRIRQYLPGCKEMSDAKRKQALAFYYRCLQKQMYVQRKPRPQILLSKNASFSAWMDLLPAYFPDARWVICTRSPLETVPSMLSTAEQAQQGFFSETQDEELLQRLRLNMQAHYRVLAQCVPALPPDQVVVIQQSELKQRLPEVLELLASIFDLNYDAEFQARIPALGERSSVHRSPHRYALSDYGLDGIKLIADCPELPSTLTTTV